VGFWDGSHGRSTDWSYCANPEIQKGERNKYTVCFLVVCTMMFYCFVVCAYMLHASERVTTVYIVHSIHNRVCVCVCIIGLNNDKY
jgi:hypothetical protein